MARLGDLYQITSGGTPSRKHLDYYQDGTIPWVKTGDLKEKYLRATDEKITEIGLKNSSARIYPKDTVLIAMYGATIGASSILKIEAATNQACAAFVKRDDVIPEYLYAFLESQQSRFIKDAVGGAQPNISAGYLKQIDMPLIPVEEQRRIAALLDKVSDLITKRRVQMDKLDLLVKARFVEMFGDPVVNPMGWEKRTLKEVCTKLTDGTHFSPESFETGEFKYITAKNIKENGFDFSAITYVSEKVHRPIFERCNPEFGDILYIKDGVTTGVAMINTLKEEFSLLSSVALLKQNRSIIDGYFLCGVLNNKEMYMDIRSNMGGAAITRLTIAKLNKIQIILPPVELQRHFASYAQQIEKIKTTVNCSLNKLEMLKKALMQQHFGVK